jgi:peptide/nickel transport system permease protein
MIPFLLRRILHGLIVAIGVTTVVFVVTRLIGDPVKVMLPLDSTEEQRAALAAKLGLDGSIWQQYQSFFRHLLHFDFGDSLWQGRPAADIVLERLPDTLTLVGTAIVLTLLFALPMGLAAATRPGRPLDKLLVGLSLTGLSLPQFWLGLLLIVLFAVQLHWLPTSGDESLRHLVLPAVSLALPSIGRLTILVRSTAIDEINRAYVRTAEAKGLSFGRILGVHVMRNAANPIITMAGWEAIRMLAGYSVVVETVFAWPGIGFLAVQSIERRDLILLQASVFTVALLVVLLTLAIDVAYKLIDPRIKLS